MEATKQLAEALGARLAAHGFTADSTGTGGDVEFAALLSHPRNGTARTVCAVLRVPDSARDVDDVRRLVKGVRRSVARRYPGLPLPRRMGTFLVLLASHEVCGRLQQQGVDLVDSGGLHVNVLVGAVLVDQEALHCRCDHVWNLLDVGDAFEHIRDTVETWARDRRRALGLEASISKRLSA